MALTCPPPQAWCTISCPRWIQSDTDGRDRKSGELTTCAGLGAKTGSLGCRQFALLRHQVASHSTLVFEDLIPIAPCDAW